MNLVICPEGHLKAVDKWGKGFYVIAKMSDVPINVAVLNFKKKQIHIFGPFDTKDFDVERMFKEINIDVEIFGEARHTEKYLPHSFQTENNPYGSKKYLINVKKDSFYIFSRKIFGGYKKTPYLCNRK